MYYSVLFPYDTTFVIKADMGPERFTKTLNDAAGLKAFSGAIYNPKSYIRITMSDTPPTMNTQSCRDINEVLIV